MSHYHETALADNLAIENDYRKRLAACESLLNTLVRNNRIWNDVLIQDCKDQLRQLPKEQLNNAFMVDLIRYMINHPQAKTP